MMPASSKIQPASGRARGYCKIRSRLAQSSLKSVESVAQTKSQRAQRMRTRRSDRRET
jgi:hypothetical protein